jgi:hypothetical protein
MEGAPPMVHEGYHPFFNLALFIGIPINIVSNDITTFMKDCKL